MLKKKSFIFVAIFMFMLIFVVGEFVSSENSLNEKWVQLFLKL